MYTQDSFRDMHDKIISAAVQQKVYVGMCAHWRLWSDCAAAHQRSLIRVFGGRPMISLEANVSSGGKLILWSDRVDAHTDSNPYCMYSYANVYLMLIQKMYFDITWLFSYCKGGALWMSN